MIKLLNPVFACSRWSHILFSIVKIVKSLETSLIQHFEDEIQIFYFKLSVVIFLFSKFRIKIE